MSNTLFDSGVQVALMEARDYQSGVENSRDGFKPQLTSCGGVDPLAVVRTIKELEGDVEAARKEAKYWTEKARAAEADAESLRLYLLKTQPPGKVGVYSLIHGESEKVVVDDVNRLSANFVVLKKEPNKKAIKEFLEGNPDRLKEFGVTLEKSEFLTIR